MNFIHTDKKQEHSETNPRPQDAKVTTLLMGQPNKPGSTEGSIIKQVRKLIKICEKSCLREKRLLPDYKTLALARVIEDNQRQDK